MVLLCSDWVTVPLAYFYNPDSMVVCLCDRTRYTLLLSYVFLSEVSIENLDQLIQEQYDFTVSARGKR